MIMMMIMVKEIQTINNNINNFFQSDDHPSGFYFDEKNKKCEKCKKWTYTEKSCAKRNEDAKNEDCHEYGEHMLNKKCFNKDIIVGKKICQGQNKLEQARQF